MTNQKIAFQGVDGRIVEIVAVQQADGSYVLGSSASIQTGDLEIGAVEIKNAGDDTRAPVGANGLYVEVRAASALPAGTNTIGGARDAGAAWTSVLGVTGETVQSADAQAGVAVTDAPVSGQKLVITDLILSAEVAMAIWFEEETSGTEFVRFYLAAGSSVQFTPRSKWKLNTADKKLIAVSSVAGNMAVTAFYNSEA